MLPNSATALPQSAPITDWARRLDEESLLELIRHYQPLLKVLAKRSWDKRLQSKIDPSDALQQTWTSISKHAGKTHFEDRRHFYSYLRKVLRNQITDIKRLLLQSQKR
ncbi:MAG: RNA polymerase sigma factor, partial [Pirellula sp.]